jgi:hypothetical protein
MGHPSGLKQHIGKYHVLHTQGFSLSDQKILVLALKILLKCQYQ